MILVIEPDDVIVLRVQVLLVSASPCPMTTGAKTLSEPALAGGVNGVVGVGGVVQWGDAASTSSSLICV